MFFFLVVAWSTLALANDRVFVERNLKGQYSATIVASNLHYKESRLRKIVNDHILIA